MFAPRRFLFGLIEVKQWLYDWGYSKAYIEIFTTDTSVYDYRDEKVRGAEQSARAADAARAEYERRKRTGYNPLEHINLNKFLNGE